LQLLVCSLQQLILNCQLLTANCPLNPRAEDEVRTRDL
jgi:hypothetical protein